MSTTFQRNGTTLRQTIEAFAGYQTAPVAGTTALLFGACAAEAHGRCPERTTIGEQTLVCSCSCHEGIDPADFDAAYGTAWWAEQREEA
jgi:hypothetical protein